MKRKPKLTKDEMKTLAAAGLSEAIEKARKEGRLKVTRPKREKRGRRV